MWTDNCLGVLPGRSIEQRMLVFLLEKTDKLGELCMRDC